MNDSGYVIQGKDANGKWVDVGVVYYNEKVAFNKMKSFKEYPGHEEDWRVVPVLPDHNS